MREFSQSNIDRFSIKFKLKKKIPFVMTIDWLDSRTFHFPRECGKNDPFPAGSRGKCGNGFENKLSRFLANFGQDKSTLIVRHIENLYLPFRYVSFDDNENILKKVNV